MTNSSGQFLDVKTLPTSGTYTVLFDLYKDITGSGTLTLYDVPADISGSITPGGAPVSVTTSVPGQNAQLTFAGTAGQRISLDATASGLAGYGAANVSILNPDGSTLTGAYPSFVTNSVGKFLDVKTLPTSGTYTILFDPVKDTTGSGTLTLYDVPADLTAPTLVVGGDAVTIDLATPGQNASLPFNGSAGQPVKLSWSNPSTWYANFKLLNPDGSTLARSAGVFATAMSGSLTATLPADGTYQVVVDGYGDAAGTVTLALNPSAAFQQPAQTYRHL